jgi:hypothetical protein
MPSRLGSSPYWTAKSRAFIKRALHSIRAQTFHGQIEIKIVIGVDAGCKIPADIATRPDLEIVEGGMSQAAALNAAARQARGDFIAFLEEDDTWHPRFLEIALSVLRGADFVSSTQIEVDEKSEVVHIQDFPTPSGWIMKQQTWQVVGEFNVAYRWHLDNEWLGRLAEKPLRRPHLVEATAPVTLSATEPRPWLRNVLKCGGSHISLVRHKEPIPLVTRLVHRASGIGQILSDRKAWEGHVEEVKRLQQRFGRIPA